MAIEKEKKRIEDLFRELGWLFHINNFEKEIVYEKEDIGSLSTICFEEDYQRITLKIYPMFFKETLENQRKTLLHELIHTITNPQNQLFVDLLEGEFRTKKQSKELLERATSQIENILDGLLQGKMSYAKEAFKKYLEVKKIKKVKRKKK